MHWKADTHALEKLPTVQVTRRLTSAKAAAVASAPEARRFGEAQAVEGQQLERLRQNELPARGRSGAVLAVAEELVDALAQQLLLAGCQCAPRNGLAHAPRCQIGLCIQVCTLEDLPQQLCHRQRQVVHPAIQQSSGTMEACMCA